MGETVDPVDQIEQGDEVLSVVHPMSTLVFVHRPEEFGLHELVAEAVGHPAGKHRSSDLVRPQVMLITSPVLTQLVPSTSCQKIAHCTRSAEYRTAALCNTSRKWLSTSSSESTKLTYPPVAARTPVRAPE